MAGQPGLHARGPGTVVEFAVGAEVRSVRPVRGMPEREYCWRVTPSIAIWVPTTLPALCSGGC